MKPDRGAISRAFPKPSAGQALPCSAGPVDPDPLKAE